MIESKKKKLETHLHSVDSNGKLLPNLCGKFKQKKAQKCINDNENEIQNQVDYDFHVRKLCWKRKIQMTNDIWTDPAHGKWSSSENICSFIRIIDNLIVFTLAKYTMHDKCEFYWHKKSHTSIVMWKWRKKNETLFHIHLTFIKLKQNFRLYD